MDWEWELAEADKECKDIAYIIYDVLKKCHVSIAQFHEIKRLVTLIVYANTMCCEEKDLTTDKDCH